MHVISPLSVLSAGVQSGCNRDGAPAARDYPNLRREHLWLSNAVANPGLVYRFGPARQLRAYEAAELLRRVGRRIEPESREAIRDLRLGKESRHLGVDL